jgi:hypothetical protein
MTALKTEKQLALACSGKCVSCKSSDIEYDLIETEDSPCQDATCNSCDAKWTEIYSVTSIEVTSNPKLDKAKDLWKQLGNIAINDDEEIEETFLDFEVGTERSDIWTWFEEEFNLSVAEDLMYCSSN